MQIIYREKNKFSGSPNKVRNTEQVFFIFKEKKLNIKNSYHVPFFNYVYIQILFPSRPTTNTHYYNFYLISPFKF